MAIRISAKAVTIVVSVLIAAAFTAAAQKAEVVDHILLIPAKTRQIDAGAFSNRRDIREIRVEAPSSLMVIGDYAFAGCDSLERVTGLPQSLAVIGEGAFRECSGLREFEFPQGVRTVPRECFIRCKSLRKVKLHDGITEIKAFAFTQCTSLRSISIPSGLEAVGLNAFALCTSLREAHLPATVTSLESYAFAGCKSLKEITLPGNPSQLGELILEDCPQLRVIREPSGAAPSFECLSWLADPVAAPAFYKRVRLIVSPEAEASFRHARCWSLFDKVDVSR